MSSSMWDTLYIWIYLSINIAVSIWARDLVTLQPELFLICDIFYPAFRYKLLLAHDSDAWWLEPCILMLAAVQPFTCCPRVLLTKTCYCSQFQSSFEQGTWQLFYLKYFIVERSSIRPSDINFCSLTTLMLSDLSPRTLCSLSRVAPGAEIGNFFPKP